MLKVDVDQFYGIEIEEFPAQVAQVALWLVDHQMNIEASEVFGEPIVRIPLTKSAHIRLGNALRIDWAEFVPPSRLNFILGNPPFVGKKEQSASQKEDLAFVCASIKGAGILDYVAGWYIKAAQYCAVETDHFGHVVARASRDRDVHVDLRFGNEHGRFGDLFKDIAETEVAARTAVVCAFVSTNSITQGEQVGIIWGYMLSRGISIRFAHRTFQWMNEAPGKAAVHCVIVGFAALPAIRRRLFEYADIKGAPHEIDVDRLNPYLVDAEDVVLKKRSMPINATGPISYGSMGIDNGHLLLSPDQRDAAILRDSRVARFIRPFTGGDEFLNGLKRYCLWLQDASPSDLALAPIHERLVAVREFRTSRDRAATQKMAQMPSLFGEIRQPESDYLLIPKVSSETRPYLPIGFMSNETIASGSCLTKDYATLYDFAILSSNMHMAWMRGVCGRMKSDYQYSAGIVYNNFPWPASPEASKIPAISVAAAGVLEARAAACRHDPKTTLAALYGANTMPPSLMKAHRHLDAVVDAVYVPDGGQRKWTNEAERVAFLFRRYTELTSLV